MKAKLLAGVAVAVITTSSVHAQSVATADPATQNDAPGSSAYPATADDGNDRDIVVTGIRASLASAQAKKRNATSIVDSIVAQDIGKLPDINVAEALQRITGVQITRSRGEGSGIAIRGLTQVRTELDGRSIFNAGSGRTLNLEDVPSELLAGADVYKSISADRIEGGIGGLIDLRLRKPFDFAGLAVAGQARGTFYDLSSRTEPSYSGLISDRWQTGIGEIGILVSGAFQRAAYRADIADGGGLVSARGVLDLNNNGSKTDAADIVNFETGRGIGPLDGMRTRKGLNAALQWQASPELQFHADGAFNQYRIADVTYSVFTGANAVVGPGGIILPGAMASDVQVFDGTNNFKSGTFLNANANPGSYVAGRTSRTIQAAGGAKYDSGAVHLLGDFSYTKATNKSFYRTVSLAASAPTLFLDLSQGYPSFRVGGVDLTDPRKISVTRAFASNQRDEGSEIAWKGDATVDIDSGFMSAMKFGVRYADRKAATATGSQSYSRAGVTVADLPGLTKLVDFDQYRSPAPMTEGFGGSGFSPRQFWATTADTLFNDFDKIRAFYGGAAGEPVALPIGKFNLSEVTFAGYAMAVFDSQVGGIRISGNAGVRVIRTENSTTGFVTRPNGTFAPLDIGSRYVDALPTLNLKADLSDKLVVRGALSKALTRPDFGQLSPTLQLNFSSFTGSAGNPALAPVRADQADLSVEYYFSPESFAYAAGFLKNVDGFITSVATTETVPGEVNTFLVTRPANGSTGKIRGIEVGWNQFLTFLPGILSGLGFQANYTYVYSAAPSPLAGSTENFPLLGLSKNSYNLVGIYEKGPLSMRLAYSWRDRYLNSLISGNQIAPDYIAPAGYLDASVNVDVTRSVTIFGEANNLTRQRRDTYYIDPQRPHAYQANDRRFSLGARFRF